MAKSQICKKCKKEDFCMYLTNEGLICFECRYPDAETEEERNKRFDKEIDEEWGV